MCCPFCLMEFDSIFYPIIQVTGRLHKTVSGRVTMYDVYSYFGKELYYDEIHQNYVMLPVVYAIAGTGKDSFDSGQFIA